MNNIIVKKEQHYLIFPQTFSNSIFCLHDHAKKLYSLLFLSFSSSNLTTDLKNFLFIADSKKNKNKF